ncbi:hypothetical protein GCM10009839_53240 [Catenulispora yoronensis]|uniref:Uncharacterized protein n=1 Tax=Catenulispora yoronensis TaxID=450799 RepID=A0ABN2UV18_9ACTN
MMRNVVGGLLVILGAAATLVSPWQAWYNGRHGSTYKFWEVFGSGVTDSRSGVTDSVFLIFLITAVAAVVGLLMRSRTLVFVASLVAFGFTILWMVRQGQAAGELTISSNNRGLGTGVANAFGGSLLMIIGALVMTGRPKEVAVADRTGAKAVVAPAPAPAPAPAGKMPESNAIPTNPPTPSAPAKPVPPPPTPSERTGTERLSKEEREMLGLDEEAPTQSKPPEK